jgi:hypothetical protein
LRDLPEQNKWCGSTPRRFNALVRKPDGSHGWR